MVYEVYYFYDLYFEVLILTIVIFIWIYNFLAI